MHNVRCTRRLASPALMAGMTTLIGLGFAGLVTPAQAQQQSSQAPIVKVAQLTAEQEAALHSEITPFDSKETPTSAPSSNSTADKSQTLIVPSLLKPNEKCGQLPSVGSVSPFPLSLRLGAMISPTLKFAGGVDMTLSGIHLLPQLTTRIDADVIISANFGGVSTLVPVTFDQIYSQGMVAGSRFYLGAGIGPYFGDVTRLGGKVFVGAGISSHLTGELGLHFPGFGDTLLTAQVRLGL